ncbi:hypothetical protein OIO90_005764 [Microbotryomycetes sp. JL221]|nr:hypothetical protein OIO90_005764 [Microbotryomycetes sp. JL221]
MSDVTEAEASRIMSHMNSEHPESLQHYLEHYFKVPPKQAKQTPTISAFSTAGGMTIQYGPVGNRQRKVYEFKPPIKAGEARKRLEEMHQEARRALGLSEIRINKCDLKLNTLMSMLAGPLLSLVLFMSTDATVLQYGSLLKKLLSRILALAGRTRASQSELATAIRLVSIVLFYSLHILEVNVQLAARLRKYNVDDPAVRKKWQLATFLGGFPVWMQLDKDAEREEKRAAKAN